MNLLLVGVGGFIGSIGRYVLAGAIHQVLHSATFPYGTMVVNILGCFVIGCLNGLAETRQMLSPELRLFLLIGVLGGFTTFSTFGYETMALLRDSQIGAALANVLVQVTVGLLCVWLGYSLVTRYL
jgi:CrcB protein